MQEKIADFALEAIAEDDVPAMAAPAVDLSEIALREELTTISICTYNLH